MIEQDVTDPNILKSAQDLFAKPAPKKEEKDISDSDTKSFAESLFATPTAKEAPVAPAPAPTAAAPAPAPTAAAPAPVKRKQSFGNALAETLKQAGLFPSATSAIATGKYNDIRRKESGDWDLPSMAITTKEGGMREFTENLGAGLDQLFGVKEKDTVLTDSQPVQKVFHDFQQEYNLSDEEVNAAWNDFWRMTKPWDKDEKVRLFSDGRVRLNPLSRDYFDDQKVQEILDNAGVTEEAEREFKAGLRDNRYQVAADKIYAYEAAIGLMSSPTPKQSSWGIDDSTVVGSFLTTGEIPTPSKFAEQKGYSPAVLNTPEFLKEYETEVIDKQGAIGKWARGLATDAVLGFSKLATTGLGLGGLAGSESMAQAGMAGSEAGGVISQGKTDTGVVGSIVQELPSVGAQVIASQLTGGLSLAGLRAAATPLVGRTAAGIVAETATGAVGLTTTLATAGAQSASMNYVEMRAQGATDEEARSKSIKSGLNTALITGIFQGLGAGGVEKAANVANKGASVTLQDIISAGTKQEVWKATRAFVSQVIKESLGEASEETIDTFTSAFLTASPNSDIGTVWNNAWESFKVGGALGGTTNILTSLVSPAVQEAAPQAAQAALDTPISPASSLTPTVVNPVYTTPDGEIRYNDGAWTDKTGRPLEATKASALEAQFQATPTATNVPISTPTGGVIGLDGKEIPMSLAQSPTPERIAQLKAERSQLEGQPDSAERIRQIDAEMRLAPVSEGGRAISARGLERIARSRLNELRRARHGTEKLTLLDGTVIPAEPPRILSIQEIETLKFLESAIDADGNVDIEKVAKGFDLVIKAPSEAQAVVGSNGIPPVAQPEAGAPIPVLPTTAAPVGTNGIPLATPAPAATQAAAATPITPTQQPDATTQQQYQSTDQTETPTTGAGTVTPTQNQTRASRPTKQDREKVRSSMFSGRDLTPEEQNILEQEKTWISETQKLPVGHPELSDNETFEVWASARNNINVNGFVSTDANLLSGTVELHKQYLLNGDRETAERMYARAKATYTGPKTADEVKKDAAEQGNILTDEEAEIIAKENRESQDRANEAARQMDQNLKAGGSTDQGGTQQPAASVAPAPVVEPVVNEQEAIRQATEIVNRLSVGDVLRDGNGNRLEVEKILPDGKVKFKYSKNPVNVVEALLYNGPNRVNKLTVESIKNPAPAQQPAAQQPAASVAPATPTSSAAAPTTPQGGTPTQTKSPELTPKADEAPYSAEGVKQRTDAELQQKEEEYRAILRQNVTDPDGRAVAELAQEGLDRVRAEIDRRAKSSQPAPTLSREALAETFNLPSDQAEVAEQIARAFGLTPERVLLEREKAATEPTPTPTPEPTPTPTPNRQPDAASVVYDLTSPFIGEALDLDTIELQLDLLDRSAAKGREIDWTRDTFWLPNLPTGTVADAKELLGTQKGRDAIRAAIEVKRNAKPTPEPTPTSRRPSITLKEGRQVETGIGQRLRAARTPAPAPAAPTEAPIKLRGTSSKARDAAENIRGVMGVPLNPDFEKEIELDNGVTVEIDSFGDFVTLTGLKTPKESRGKGLATQALKDIVSLADDEGVPLRIVAEPFGTEGMSKAQLIDWYGKEGFELQQDGETMIRQPKPARFSPEDKVILTSPATGEEIVVSFRGYEGNEAVVWTGRTQMRVPVSALRKLEAPAAQTETPAPAATPAPEPTAEGEFFPNTGITILPSDQSKNADYVLYVTKGRNYHTLWGGFRNNRGKVTYNYLTILSQDADEAIEKANAYARQMASGEKLSVAFSGRFQESAEGAKTLAVAEGVFEKGRLPDIEKAPSTPLGEQKLGGNSRAADILIKDLWEQAPDQANWIINNGYSGRLREVAAYLKTQPEWLEMQDERELESARIAAYEKRRAERENGKDVPVTTLVRKDGEIVEVDESGPAQPQRVKLTERKAKDQVVDIVPPTTNVPNLVPRNLADKMFPMQVSGANATLASMKANGVALNGDGAGVGKTRQILAVADHYAKQGKQVIIITENAAIGKPWEKKSAPKLGGSMAKDSEAMGITLGLLGEQQGDILVTTYNRVKASDIPDGAILIFDESHNLANTFGANPDEKSAELKQWETKFRDMLPRAEAVAYYSATPADKPHQLAYLHKILGFDTPAEYLDAALEAGMALKTVKRGNKEQQYYDVPKGAKKTSLYNWVNGRMIEAGNQGRFIKREISYEGTDVQFEDISGSDVNKNPWAQKFQDAMMDMQAAQNRGMRLLAPDSYVLYAAELSKIGRAIDLAKREIQAGRKVVIYFSRIRDMEIKARPVLRGADGELMYGDPEVVGIIPSPVELIKTELQKDGIAFAELHGKSGLTSQQAQNAFAGTTNVLLASVESGGTGINLDDTKGDNPRTEIFMFAPYRGISTVQAMGRIWRASTIQNDNNPNRYAMIVASDVVPDAMRSAVLAKKLQLMNAAIGGTAVARLPMSKTNYDPKQLKGLEIAEDGESSSLDRQPTGILRPVKVDWKLAKSGRYYSDATADVLEWEERGGAERVGIDVRVFKGDRGWMVIADRPYTPEEFTLPEEAVPDVPTAPTPEPTPTPEAAAVEPEPEIGSTPEPLPTPTTPPPQDNPVSTMLAEGAAKIGKVESVNPASNTAIIEVKRKRGIYYGGLDGKEWTYLGPAPRRKAPKRFGRIRTKVMRLFEDSPIMMALDREGGFMSASAAQRIRGKKWYAKNKSQWEGARNLPRDPRFTTFYNNSQTANNPEQAADALYRAGALAVNSPDALFDAIAQAIESAKRVESEEKEQEQKMATAEDFALLIGQGELEIPLEKLSTYDRITVAGEDLTVTAIKRNKYTGEIEFVRFEGGEKFGTQTVEGFIDAIYVDDYNDEYQMSPEEIADRDAYDAADRGMEDFTLESATDEQLRQEAAAQRQRDLIAEGQARQLTGGAGDLTADMFGEGDTSLFNERRDNLRLQSDARNETINQSEPIEVADSEKTSENGQVYSIIPYAQPKAKPELSTEMKAAIIQKLRGLQPDQPPINVFFDSVKDEPVTLVDESTGVTVIDSAESVIEDEQGQQVTLRANETIAAQATKLLSDASKRSYAAFVGAGKWTANVASRFAKDFADFAMGEKFPSAISDIFSRFMVSLKPTVLAGLSFFSMTNFVGQEIVVSKAEEATVQGAEIKKFTAINPPKTKDGSYIGALIDIRSAPQPPKYEGESISVHDEVKNDAATVLDYVTSTGDNNGKPFVIVSKREGSIRAYDKDGNLVHKSTVLLGKSYGDVVLNRRRDLDQIRDNDKLKVTPSGRWETKTDTSKEYGRVVPLEEYEGGTRNAIHAVCTKFPHERRLDRLAGKLPNRISYGCINVYASTATKINDLMEDGGVVYVTPDEQTIEGYIEDLSEDDGTRYQEDFTAEDEAYFDAIDRRDKETAQRMVNKAARMAGKMFGKWFHGQNATERFNTFDPTKGSSFGGWNVFGSWFTLDEKAAKGWAKHYELGESGKLVPAEGQVYESFLFIENPLSLDGYDALLSLWEEITGVATNGATKADADKFKQELLRRGYDGLVVSNVENDSPEGADASQTYAIALDPSQIKSADPVTYDANGNPIPLSQRFNPESDDIRYQMDTEYAPETPEETVAFEKASSNKVLARSPELAVAAVRLANGQITAGQYADLVDYVDPFTVKGAEQIPSEEKIKTYIASDKKDKVNAPIPSGKEVEFRIDIPTYNRSTAAGDTVYAVTAHEPVPDDAKKVGTPISYVGVARVLNPTMMTRAISGKGQAIDIAQGSGKFPLATVKGLNAPITELPANINDPAAWTEVSYNPIRSSYFVDVRSKEAVIGGDEAIMVGSRVFVRNPTRQPRPRGFQLGADIRYQRRRRRGQNAKGFAKLLEDGRVLLKGLLNSDFTTAVHEMAHAFEMTGYTGLTDEEVATLKNWAGDEGTDNRKMMGRKASEKFARGWERYLADGKAPFAELQAIFDKMAKWMMDTYKTIAGSPIDVEISPEVRAIFDKIAARMVAPSTIVTPTGSTMTTEDGSPLPPAVDPATLETIETDEQLVGVARFYLENPLPPPREFNTPEGEPLPYALQRARADQEAALYGYDTAAWNQAAREFPELWERVMNESAGTGEAELDKLMMSSDPDRPLSDLEVARFTLEGLRRKAVLNKALTELQTAISSGNQKMVEEKQKLVDAASARYQTMLNQIARSRTAAGRALNAWKFALNEDFSQTTLYSRALTNYNSVRVANGKPAVNSLPQEEAKAVAQFAERMAKMQDEIDALKEAQRIGTDRANEQQAMIEVLKAERDAARAAKSTKVQDATRKVLVDKVRKAAKEARERLGLPPIDDNVRFQADPASDSTWRDRVIVLAEILIANPLMSTAQFADRVRNMFGEAYAAAAGRLRNDAEEYLRPMMEDLTGKERPTPEKVLESIDGSVELTNEMVYDLAKAHVFAGARDTQVITNVHNDLKDFYPDLTREDVAQLFTRYGETRDMNRSDEAKALRAAKSLELVQRQIDNLLTDGVMKRTGTKKDDPDIKLRELRKKRDDLAKDLGYVPVDPETQLSSAQTAAKKRMKNEMEELQNAIDTNTPIVRVKRGVTYTEDMEQMRANLEELRKSYESIFGQQRTPAERMKAVIKDLDRRIAKERELINKGILKEDESTNPVAVDSPEISARRELLKELRRQKEEAYDLANPGLRAAEVALKEAQRITKSWINKLAASQSDTPTWKSSSKPSAVEELIKSHIENPQPDFAQRLIDLGATAEQARILDSEIRSEVERRRIVADARNSPMEREARILRDLDRRIEAEKKLIDQGLIKPKKSVDYVLDSPEISARRERLKELKRQKYEAYDALHPNERALDQAMEAAQKALERRQKIITEGLPAAKDKPARDANVTPTAELEALWEAADEMDVLITEMRKNRPLTPAQQLRQLDNAYDLAVKTREKLKKRIADGDLLPDSKAKPTVEERTRLVRAENEELRKQITQMQRDAGVGAFAYDVREAKKVAALEKSIEELKRKRAQKDFSKRKTTEPVTSERIRTLELIKANERREYEQERAMAAFKTLGWGKKTIEIAMATWNARQILNLSGDFGVINRNYGKVQLFTLWNDVVTLLRKRGKARFSEDTIIGKVLSKGFEAFMDEKAEERLYAEMATDPRYAKMKDEGFTLVSPHESSHEITADGRVRINPMFIFNDKIIGALALLKGILHTGVSVALLPKTGGATWKEVLKGVAKTIGGAALAIGGARYAKRVERANRVMLNVGRWALLDAAGKIAGNVDPSMKPEYDKITTEALMTLTGQFAGRSGATKWLKSHSSALSIIFSFPQYVVTNMQSVLGIPLISAMYRADALNPKALAAALTKKKGPDTPDVNWKAVQAVATLQAQYYIGTAAKIWFWALVLGAWDDEDKESKGGVVVDSDHPQFGSIKIGNTFIDLNPRANKWVSDISRLLGDTIPDSDKLKEGKIVPDKMTPYIKSEMFKKMWYSQLNMNWKALADMSSGKLYQGGEIGKMGMLYATDAVISEFASNLTARDITKMHQLHGKVKGTALSSLILLGANATVRETQDEYKKRKAEESRKYKPEYR